MNKNQKQKLNQKIKIDYDHYIFRVNKHHLVLKIIEVALFVALFALSAAAASAAPITDTNLDTLINKERTDRGLAPLKVDDQLNKAAQEKSTDMINRNYFDHYAYGLTPWDFVIKQNYDYLYAGENLAMDFNSAEGVVNAWMNSKTHRDNILNPDFSDTGIGIVKGAFTDSSGTRETVMITNMFGTRKPAVMKIFDSFINAVKYIF